MNSGAPIFERFGSIFGTWIFSPNGSDFFPGANNLPDAPLSIYFSGNDTDELVISKKGTENFDEIFFDASIHGTQVSRAYQVEKWNIEKYKPNPIAAVIFFAESSLILLKYGPLTLNQSLERISASTNGRFLTIDIEYFTQGGSAVKMKKVFSRKPQTMPNFERIIGGPSSSGWLNPDFRSSSLLKTVKVTIIEVKPVVSPAPFSPSNEKSVSSGNLLTITRRIDGKKTDGEKVVMFVIQVSCGSKSWNVAHRYKEFDVLRLYILNRQNLQSSKYWQKVGPEPPFPRKSLISVGINDSLMSSRSLGLQDFLRYHVSLGGHEIQSVVDALVAFLEIPHHLFTPTPLIHDESTEPSLNSVNSNSPSNSLFSKSSLVGKASNEAPRNADNAATLKSNDSTSSSAPKAEQSSSFSGGDSKTINTSTVSTPDSSVATDRSSTPVSSTVTSKPKFRMCYSDLCNLSIGDIPLSLDTSIVFNFPQDAIHAILLNGIFVIKHGRSGAPKEKLLRCDGGVTKLYWQEKPSNKDIQSALASGILDLSSRAKFLLFSDILSIRKGTDPDPELDSFALDEIASPDSNMKKKRSFSLIKGTPQKAVLGTKVLRRASLSQKNLELSFSLILSDRTFDIQCLTPQDFNFLYSSFLAYLSVIRAYPVPS